MDKAIVTLLTSPSYLPGTLVLLHALHALHPAPRDFKIVCLVTPETVDVRTIAEVRKAGYDLVIGVEGIGSGAEGEAGLGLMGRPDLNLALTKLHLFRLSPLFHTLIYLDADVLPLRPLDHLFESTAPHVLSACSDTGWPDCFNSGVMVIRPRESDFEGMRGLITEATTVEGGLGGNGSFDGADQGLLNEWFSEEGGGGDWNRLSFTYNVTPSAAYQYAPAYKRYGHKISAVHFIGRNKPWSNLQHRPAGISNVTGKEAAFDYSSLLDRWYSIYDAHVRPTSAHPSQPSSRFTVPQTQAIWDQSSIKPSSQSAAPMDLEALKAATATGASTALSGQGAYISLPLDGRVDLIMPKTLPKSKGSNGKSVSFASSPISASPSPPPQQVPAHEQKPQQSQSASWDGQHYSPPKSSLPEMSTQISYYQNAWDAPPSTQSHYYDNKDEKSRGPRAEPQYPTLPASVVNDSWYAAFTSGPAPNQGSVGAVFPWEGKGEIKRAERVFPRGSTPPPSTTQQSASTTSVNETTRSPASYDSSSSSHTPSSTQPQSLSEAMASYRNAWDSDPSITAYISRITGSSSPRNSISVERGLMSVPQTPRFSPDEKTLAEVETRSDGSGDGDDEGEGDSDDHVARGGGGGGGKRNPNPRYRDRGGQTEKTQTTDVGGMWDGPTSSPEVSKRELGPPGLGKGVRQNSNTSSGSESTITSLPDQQTQPSNDRPSTLKPRRIPYHLSQPSSDRIPQRQLIGQDRDRSSPGVVTSSLPSGISPTQGQGFSPSVSGNGSPSGSGGSGGSGGSAGGLGGIGRRNDNSGGRPNHGRRGSESVESDNLTANGEPKIKASRTFDPNTSVESRRRDTQEVLTRFMRAGQAEAVGEVGENGKKGEK